MQWSVCQVVPRSMRKDWSVSSIYFIPCIITVPTLQNPAPVGGVPYPLPPVPSLSRSCVDAMVELLLCMGIEPNPGPLTICSLCFDYETDLKSNMTRHVKFTCPNRGDGLQPEARRSRRRQEKVKINA